MLNRLRALFEPGEIRLSTYLLIALAVRIPAVLFSCGYEFLDHQYQYVDPAYMLGLGGSWYQTYDYVLGHRSWVYPGMLAGLLWALDAIGITEAGAMMAATRFVHALISLLPVAAFWFLVVRWKGLRGQRPLLLLFACNGIAVYAGVQPTGVTFALGMSLLAIFVFHAPGRWWPLVSGLLLGFAFACRFQDAFFGPALALAGVLQKRWGAVALLALGSAITLTASGFVDLATWGHFFHSPLRYYYINVTAGFAIERGLQPVWYYAAVALGLLVLVPPFLRSGVAALRDGGRVFPVLLGAGLFYIAVHNLFPRKAFRFVLPALVLLFVVYGKGLIYATPGEPKLRTLHRRLFVGVQIVLLGFVSFWYFSRGPVEAARALSRLDDFQDRLVAVDCGYEQVGGHFYLRRKQLEVIKVPRAELPAWLEEHRPATPLYLMVAKQPLSDELRSGPWSFEEVGHYTDFLDLRRRTRRWLYRLGRK